MILVVVGTYPLQNAKSAPFSGARAVEKLLLIPPLARCYDLFQADHALYTPGLDENRVIGDFVHSIWTIYEVHCTKFCTR